MVFLDLSVNSIKKTYEFYCDKIGLFSGFEDSLKCEVGTELTLWLRDTATKEHAAIFETNNHVITSFQVCFSSSSSSSSYGKLIERLERNNIEYTKRSAHVGVDLIFNDPSGNRFIVYVGNQTIMENT
jgi:extradiol dioxygenase family protein